ncbi:GyrI-like domain-containing protein [Flagellimonas sp. CMM7]|uniref:GyrI-like domain-containing protein n=1 Tax=Flagellimonas sp. CMM7 TaxID=2654676 RepID=UPI0013D33A5F|nr:GyrI-like domain-containing protein [Flagellimonas sp. CMM7]UII78182.1 AraC family transcriptional regulator [Flagellimonas sp. CMM7]
MKRKISLVTATILIAFLGWYFFVKPNDYLITFTANSFPGTINQTIKSWDKRMQSSVPLEQDGLLNIKQQLKFGDSIVQYDWEIIPITDSTSKIKVRVKDLNNSFMNKLMIPFASTVIEERSKKNLVNFNQYLNNHIKSFKVSIIGEDEIKPTFCAYLTVRGLQAQKAFEMMRDHPFLSGFVKQNNLELNGSPFVEITKWNIETDSVEYNFCYPIRKSDSLPKNDEIRYKDFKGVKGIKAIYNGNYITSDRAWYKLLDYAQKNDIEVINTPIEVFYNNPSLGGNELEWKAEIFMPIKESQ